MALNTKKEFLGQPWWIWAAGGTVVVAGLVYILWKSRQQGAAADAAATSPGAGAEPSSPTGLTTGQLQGWIIDQQSSPASPAPATSTTTTTETANVGGLTTGQAARKLHVSVSALEQLNPWLKQRKGKLSRGTKVKVPVP